MEDSSGEDRFIPKVNITLSHFNKKMQEYVRGITNAK